MPYITDALENDFMGQNLATGDIVFADAAEDESVGKATEIAVQGQDCVVSGLHTIACSPTFNTGPYYFGYYLNSYSYRRQLMPLMQGIKVLSLSKANLANTNISIPKDLLEQQKIGSFFQSLDNLITLHQRKQKRQMSSANILNCPFVSISRPKKGNKWRLTKQATLCLLTTTSAG